MNSSTSIQTFTGTFFDPFDPSPSLICIEDIAHSLSLQCRFSGHTRRHMSIAEHSIRVAWLCPNECKLEGLLHDAAEAYLIDLPRPIKQSPTFGRYREIDGKIEHAIAERFGLMHPWPGPVKLADNLMLWAEAEALMRGSRDWMADGADDTFGDQIAGLADQIRDRPFSSHAAESAFLSLYEHIKR